MSEFFFSNNNINMNINSFNNTNNLNINNSNHEIFNNNHLLPLTNIDNTKCYSRKNKLSGLLIQCNCKKKIGDYCVRHSKSNNNIRVDETITEKQYDSYLKSCIKINLKNNKNNNKNLKNNENIINNENNEIEIQDYVNNKELNYNCNILRKTLKNYKLIVKGNKNEMKNRLKNFFDKLIPYYEKNDKIIKLQKNFRLFLHFRNIKLRGPGFINRKLCNNQEDFFTFEELKDISDDRFFSFKDKDNFIYGFDIKSFHKLIQMKMGNPYNRNKIPIKAISNMNKILEINKSKNLLEEDKSSINNKQHLNNRILEIFHQVEMLGVYTGSINIELFLELQINKLKLYYKALEDIWNYRAELNQTQKYNIIKDKVMFTITVHQFYKMNNLKKMRNIILTELEKLIFTADLNEDKALGCYYMLTAFCEVSNSFAILMPWLCQNY